MDTLYVILYLLAAICFLVGSFVTTTATTVTARVNLIALGLLFWVAVPFIRHLDTMGD